MSYAAQLPALILGGVGMALYFAPAANNALREVGGALGIASLSAVFSAQGGYESAQSFVDGLGPALWAGADPAVSDERTTAGV